MSPRTLAVRPLTKEAFAPYGEIICASPRGEPGKPVNMGLARRYDHVAVAKNLRPRDAGLNLAVFRCQPQPTFPVRVSVLEKHPCSSQAFFPMNASRYLVVAALGKDEPDLSTIAAFIADGRQGIVYAPGVWHFPLVTLDRETDFGCIVFEDGGDEDCIVRTYAEAEQVELAMP